MAEYNKKWADLFPATIGNQNRPAAGVDNTLPYETDKFPQHIANDPVRYDKMNAVVSQSMSNDERLNEKIKRTSDDLAAHNKDPKAHATGIAGNAATASKLASPRTISLTGKAAGSTTFDGSANASINVTSVNADTASKLSTARKINITGNASGSASFDGSSDININTTVNESKHAAAADVATKVNATAPNGGAADLVFGIMADDDSARIRVGGSSDNGWLEIATSDNGNEPIYVRQYRGSYLQDGAKTVTNEAILLDGSGNTKFPHNVTAANFVGHLAGNADSATKLAAARTISLTGNASGSANFDGGGNVSINTTISQAANADKVDGYHENSFLRYRGAAAATGEDTLWGQIGVKEYDGKLPKGVSGTYSYGAVVSLPGNSSRLDIWYNHQCSTNKDGLWYRSGFGTDQKAWARLLDSNNYTNWAPTKTGSGASGTWDISITGNAASATNADKLDGYHASDIIGKIYPVGSIYISVSGTNPASLFGIGTWVEVGQGRTLWGADSSHAAGSTIEAGLPNITGTLDSNNNDGTNWKTGAFYDTGRGAQGADGDSGGGIIAFDASRSNAIYGKSSTVQPPALVVHFWKRTA